MKRTAVKKQSTDFLILLFVLGLVAAGTMGIRALLYGKGGDTPPAHIVIHIEGVDASLADAVHVGERVIDRTNRRLLGTVSEIRLTPSVTEIAPARGGEAAAVERAGLVNMDLVLIPDHDHTGYFVTPRVWSVGSCVTFATPSLAAVGTIVRIER